MGRKIQQVYISEILFHPKQSDLSLPYIYIAFCIQASFTNGEFIASWSGLAKDYPLLCTIQRRKHALN